MKKQSKKKKARLRIPDCKHFTGYKPCFPDTRCYQECVDNDPIGKKILIVNLDAMGNVLVTASILPPLKKKYPRSTVYWITLKNAAPLLANNPLIDRVYLWEPESWLILQQMKFDVVLNVDKSGRSCAFTNSLTATKKLGFALNKNGVIVPLNKEARENFILGLDDHLKFRVNQKTVSQLQCEQFQLKYKRDRYLVHLSDAEKAFCEEYKRSLGLSGKELVVGFNTGCSELYPNKKMTIEQHVTLIKRLSFESGVRLVLLGGPEDMLRNAEIYRQVGDAVINTPTTEGVRRGLCYVNICDVVISGDSFGMHAAIALQKYVIVWFGVSCWTEIDLFENGVKLIPEGLACSPCWKKKCPYNLECIQMIDLDAVVHHVLTHRSGRFHRVQ
ncbi:MAG: glycosyltransferase family 9 protein [Bacteroidota bacterium]